MEIFQPDIFPFNIAVGTPEDTKHFVDCNHEEIKINNSALGVTIKAYKVETAEGIEYTYVLLIFPKKPTTRTITHEAFHATCALMELIDTPLTNETEETWAYTIGYIAECIEKTFNK